MNIWPGFGGSTPAPPAALAPIPTREDPALAEAREKTRLAERRRKGRAATILTDQGEGESLGTGAVARPEARKAQVLGG